MKRKSSRKRKVRAKKASIRHPVAWEDAYKARFDGSKFGNDAIGLFALGLQYGIDDLDAVGADSIVGGGGDKKCDLLFFDEEEGRCIVAQCYVAQKSKTEAPANKASDLNTAITWLLTTPISKVPAQIRATAQDIRNAIKDDRLSELCIWYVHNCPESKNVANEIEAVEHAAHLAVRRINPDAATRILAKEFGSAQFSRLYQASGSAILVTQEVRTLVPDGYFVSSGDWNAYQTFVPGTLIYDLFKKYSTDLFSANVRDYLGSRESDANINHGIKETAKGSPENFWVYNNGITALVNDLTAANPKGNEIALRIKGISIVNGAQTTGAIGSLERKPSERLVVPIRFIWTNNRDRIQDIIRFNNSQNKISASDFRSTDAIQRRLKQEFENIPQAEYEGGRRGGASDTIKRRPDLMPSYTVGQALAAFHGDPVVAYDRKSEIWINDQIYSSYFNENTTARHIVFVYSLYKAVANKKVELLRKQREGNTLTKAEQEQLQFFEKKGSIPLVCAAIAECLETILSQSLPNKFRLSFGPKISPEKAEVYWAEVCEPLFALVGQHLASAFSPSRISTEPAKKAIPMFRSVVQAVAIPNKSTFQTFAARVKVH